MPSVRTRSAAAPKTGPERYAFGPLRFVLLHQAAQPVWDPGKACAGPGLWSASSASEAWEGRNAPGGSSCGLKGGFDPWVGHICPRWHPNTPAGTTYAPAGTPIPPQSTRGSFRGPDLTPQSTRGGFRGPDLTPQPVKRGLLGPFWADMLSESDRLRCSWPHKGHFEAGALTKRPSYPLFRPARGVKGPLDPFFRPPRLKIRLATPLRRPQSRRTPRI